MPSVSIITPTYNRAQYIKEAIESVISQTYSDWELIVVDDGSTDQTFEILDKYAKQDKRIRYIRQSNAGPSTARNTALAQVSGKYIAFIDDDDRWLPEKLKLQVELMESDPETGFCYVRFQIYKKAGNNLEKGMLFPQFLATKFEDLFDVFIAPSSSLFRKTCLDQAGRFNPLYERCEDFDLWLRIGQICKITPIDQIGVFSVMDDRHHGMDSEIKTWKIGIELIRKLQLNPQHQYCKPFLKTHIAKRYYWIGRADLDFHRHWSAALNFTRSVLADPGIGLEVRRSEDQKNFTQVMKPYFAIPVSLIKGLIYGRR